MTDYVLDAEPRTLIDRKVRRLRAQGYVPAVLYGGGKATQILKIASRHLETVVGRAGVNNLLSLRLGPEEQTVLIRDLQRDAIRRSIVHLDLIRIVVGEEITTEIGILLRGESPIGGIVVQDMNSLQVRCLPKDLIPSVEADIQNLSADGSTIVVKELDMPESITVLADPDDLVAHFEPLMREEEEEEPELALGVDALSSLGVSSEDFTESAW